jgi:hypothetical protein
MANAIQGFAASKVNDNAQKAFEAFQTIKVLAKAPDALTVKTHYAKEFIKHLPLVLRNECSLLQLFPKGIKMKEFACILEGLKADSPINYAMTRIEHNKLPLHACFTLALYYLTLLERLVNTSRDFDSSEANAIVHDYVKQLISQGLLKVEIYQNDFLAMKNLYPFVYPKILHFAASEGATALCTALIALKLDPNECLDGPGSVTPLHLAASRGHLAVVRLLVEAGANVRQRVTREPSRSPYRGKSSSVLCYAAEYPQVIEYLVGVGADVNAVDLAPINRVKIKQRFMLN